MHASQHAISTGFPYLGLTLMTNSDVFLKIFALVQMQHTTIF